MLDRDAVNWTHVDVVTAQAAQYFADSMPVTVRQNLAVVMFRKKIVMQRPGNMYLSVQQRSG